MVYFSKMVISAKQVFVPIAFLLLSGCSLFGGDDVDLSKPAELLDFEPTLSIERNWTVNVGSGSEEIYPVSIPVLLDGVIYVGDRSGRIQAVEKDSGRVLWKTDIDETVTGAIGIGGELALVGTEKGEVQAFDRSTGEFRWREQLSSQILAAPATNGETVVAVSQDGKLYGLSAADGARVWLVDISLPLLTVHGSAKPTVVNDIAYIGLDNGKAAAYRMSDGVGLWEVRVGVPEGKNDLERMVDIDGQVLYHSGNIYASAYQSGVMAINPQAGRGLWFQEGSSQNSPGAWGGTLVITQDDGIVKAYNANDGTVLWETEEFKNRQPNGPVLTSDYVAFADYQGYMHFLARRTGQLIGREKSSGGGVRSPTLIDGDDVFILTNSGKLSSYRVSER